MTQETPKASFFQNRKPEALVESNDSSQEQQREEPYLPGESHECFEQVTDVLHKAGARIATTRMSGQRFLGENMHDLMHAAKQAELIGDIVKEIDALEASPSNAAAASNAPRARH